MILPRGSEVVSYSSQQYTQPDRDLIDLALTQPRQQSYRYAVCALCHSVLDWLLMCCPQQYMQPDRDLTDLALTQLRQQSYRCAVRSLCHLLLMLIVHHDVQSSTASLIDVALTKHSQQSYRSYPSRLC